MPSKSLFCQAVTPLLPVCSVCPCALSRAGMGWAQPGSHSLTPREVHNTQRCFNLQLNQAKTPPTLPRLGSDFPCWQVQEWTQMLTSWLGVTKTKTSTIFSLKLLKHQYDSPPSPWTNQPPKTCQHHNPNSHWCSALSPLRCLWLLLIHMEL